MIKQIILSRWDFMRWLRLALGVFLIFNGISQHDILAGMVGTFFTVQTLMNVGCCGMSACSVQKPANKEIITK